MPEDTYSIPADAWPTTKSNKTILPHKPEAGIVSLLSEQVIEMCGSEGFHINCWARLSLLYVYDEDTEKMLLDDQKFFVDSESYIKWFKDKQEYVLKMRWKKAVIHEIYYDSGTPKTEVYIRELKTKREDSMYLNGPKADKEKLNAFLHKVGKHHV